MAKSTATQVQPTKRGLFAPIFKPLSWVCLGIAYIFVAMFIGVLIEWVGMLFFWPSDHAQQVMIKEITLLNKNLTTSLTGHNPVTLGVVVANYMKALLTENIFVLYMTSLANSYHDSRTLQLFASFLHFISYYLQAAVFVIMTLCIRLTIVILSSAIIVVVLLVGAADGLVEREIRYYEGDFEHSRIVHIAMDWTPRLALIAPAAYLTWPGVALPSYFFVPAMVLFAGTVFIVFSQYQKRL